MTFRLTHAMLVSTYASFMCSRMELLARSPSPDVTTATPAHHALAEWLVTSEMAAAQGPLTCPAAAGRVFDKLGHRLAQLITPVGSDALLRRAVHLSRTEFPFLDGVQAAPATDSLIDTLRESASRVEPNQAYKAFVMVVGTLVALLESFIGPDLTFRLLRDVWPKLPVTPQSSADGQH
jgi:hypothetical protein